MQTFVAAQLLGALTATLGWYALVDYEHVGVRLRQCSPSEATAEESGSSGEREYLIGEDEGVE
jgi:hypothetical protein|tara:strand:+ start:1864 stop:2052 length:189 start_codon:yes stop_codon:yes gene_type:complete